MWTRQNIRRVQNIPAFLSVFSTTRKIFYRQRYGRFWKVSLIWRVDSIHPSRERWFCSPAPGVSSKEVQWGLGQFFHDIASKSTLNHDFVSHLLAMWVRWKILLNCRLWFPGKIENFSFVINNIIYTVFLWNTFQTYTLIKLGWLLDLFTSVITN